MSLASRLKALAHQLPPPRRPGIPTDPEALLTGLINGRVNLADFDRTDADQVAALAYASAVLVRKQQAGRPA